MAASPRLPADDETSFGHNMNQQGARSHQSGAGVQRLTTAGRRLQQLGGTSLQLEFQDSNLSPALSLLPVNQEVEENFTEYSLFQKSDTEFVPLRPYPDNSTGSERFPAHENSTQFSHCASLSQHPLAQTSLLSEGGASSSCNVSQHSLSLQQEGGREEPVHTNVQRGSPSRDASSGRESPTDPSDKPVGGASEVDVSFLSWDVPAQHLLELLQRDVGMPSSSSSAVSEAALKSAASISGESESSKTHTDHSTSQREGPPGEASLPQLQTQKPDQSRGLSPEVCNITMGSRSTQPDDSSERLHRELLSETQGGSGPAAPSERQTLECVTLPGESLTPRPSATAKDKPSVTRTNRSTAWTGPSLAGVDPSHREQDLWSSGNQTGIDGSYLGFLPKSQSTPGVFKAPSKSTVKPLLGHLSAIESHKDSSRQSSTGVSPEPAGHVLDAPHSSTVDPDETSCAKVQSLPSLNYMQKVDAWRENQSSGKTSLFDSLALQGFSGISPKKKAYDAVSDTLNRILSQQVAGSRQPPVSSAATLTAAPSSSVPQSGSSSARRGEAVGSAPCDNDDGGSAAHPSASPCHRSQPHSSLSTVVMSVKKDHQTAAEKDASQKEVRQQPGTSGQAPPPITLRRFSDVSLDLDLISSSQDSYNSGMKLGTSIRASSAVSLEVDNYAPYWTSKLSTPPPKPRELNIDERIPPKPRELNIDERIPPKPRELNIDERIPLYLHNLGIDQSPSTILTPFAPRGPIREPEFSPTDLCTIKGSMGTPSKSTQTSEGGSPHKRAFSRSSAVSEDSSVSAPFSLDSLVPPASVPEGTQVSPSAEAAARLSSRLVPCAQSDKDSHDASTLQQRDSSAAGIQKPLQRGDWFDSDPSSYKTARCGDRDSEALFRANHGVEQSPEEALLEIRRRFSQADNGSSAGSAAPPSSSPVPPRLLADDDLFMSQRKKAGRLQDFSFSSSSTAGEPRTHSSLLWTRSSSDSMLTSEKPRESSIGQERMTSSGQPPYLSSKAVVTAPAAETCLILQNSPVPAGAGASLVLPQPARRAEPEGCSAAPPDTTAPPQPPVIKPPPAVNPQEFPSTVADTADVPEEEEEQSTRGEPVESSPPPPVPEDPDQGLLSDGSSQSSLTVRVAKLLQRDSPASIISSTSSITDHQTRTREGKTSGQQGELPLLQLDQEDEKQIEEMLLLLHPTKSLGSTDSSSRAGSSVSGLGGQDQPQPTETVDANNRPTSQLQRLGSQPPPDPRSANLPRLDLEAKVREIAAREGVTLPRTSAQALTSITIATCRRSASPSPSTSPAPPHSPAQGSLHLTELSGTAEHPAAQRKAAPPLDEDDQTNLSSAGNQKRRDTEGGQFQPPPPSSLSLHTEDVTVKDDITRSIKPNEEFPVQDHLISVHGAEQTPVDPPVRTSHISHVRLTLVPKDHSVPAASLSRPSGPAPPRKDFVPLRHSSPAVSSPDEGLGLSSPPEWHDTREPVGTWPERTDTSTLFKTLVPQGRGVSAAPAPSASRQTSMSPVSVLLPYKPRGSEKLFYFPQAEAGVLSDTTMESSHPGSDDAVPPHFGSDVLGQQDPGLDRGVTIRHSEGIYSKRSTMPAGRRGVPVAAGTSSQSSRAAKPSSQVSFAKSPPLSRHGASVSKRDQGTSPVHFPSGDWPEPAQPGHSSGSPTGADRGQSRRQVDQLLSRICEQWSLEENRPTRDSEALLLERLQHLSHLVHSTRAADGSGPQTRTRPDPEQEFREEDDTRLRTEKRRDMGEAKRFLRVDARESEGRSSRKVDGRRPVLQQGDESRGSFTSSISQDSSHSRHLCPADRDESEAMSTVSGSMSTVDTARLIRAFGTHRVQNLKTSSRLSRLYSTISKQKDARQQDVVDSSSSTSTYIIPPAHRPGAKRGVRLVSRGVQAGDLEIVSNATRRHTRDVGTTFPSPSEARSSSSSSTDRDRRGPRSLQKLRKTKRNVSWFITADELRTEARKENQPEEEDELARSTAWFEPYRRTDPWREPLRLRQVHEHQNTPPPDPPSKTRSSGVVRVSLQEALATCRPDFIVRSRQRVQRLSLQVEERKLQAAFSRERDQVFLRPGGLTRLPRPAAVMARAVPRKEMIQRTKQIYENLPEVQRRREEQRRQTEYRSYRLNARLYNQRITNHVLGRRRAAWQ